MSHPVPLDTVTAGKCQNCGAGKPRIHLCSKRDVLSTATVDWLDLGSIFPHRPHADRDVVCVGRDLQVPGISEWERALEFML